MKGKIAVCMGKDTKNQEKKRKNILDLEELEIKENLKEDIEGVKSSHNLKLNFANLHEKTPSRMSSIDLTEESQENTLRSKNFNTLKKKRKMYPKTVAGLDSERDPNDSQFLDQESSIIRQDSVIEEVDYNENLIKVEENFEIERSPLKIKNFKVDITPKLESQNTRSFGDSSHYEVKPVSKSSNRSFLSKKMVKKHHGEILRIFTRGSFFGELILEGDEDASRTASGIAFTDADLIVIGQNEYDQYFKRVKREKDKKKLEILAKIIPEVKEMEKKDILPLTYSLHLQEVNKGDYLLREGEISDRLMIIVSGEISIQKKATTQSLLKIIEKSKEVEQGSKTEAIAEAIAKTASTTASTEFSQVNTFVKQEKQSRRELEFLQKIQKHTVGQLEELCDVKISEANLNENIILSKIGKLEILGEECLVSKEFGNLFSAKCLSETQIIYIGRKEVFNYFPWRFRSWLVDSYMKKTISRMKKFSLKIAKSLQDHSKKVRAIDYFTLAKMLPLIDKKGKNAVINGFIKSRLLEGKGCNIMKLKPKNLKETRDKLYGISRRKMIFKETMDKLAKKSKVLEKIKGKSYYEKMESEIRSSMKDGIFITENEYMKTQKKLSKNYFCF